MKARKSYANDKKDTIARIAAGNYTACERALLQCLADTPRDGWHVADMAARSGYSAKHVQKALMCLRLAGLAAYTGRGRGTRWCSADQLANVKAAQAPLAPNKRNDDRRAERLASPVLSDEPVRIIRRASECDPHRGGPASIFAMGAGA